MKDLHINIGGPRDQARQNVSFKIAQAGDRPAIEPEQVVRLVGQLRDALEQSNLSADERRRAQRHLTTIEEEAASETPMVDEIHDAVTFLGKLVETAHGLAPLFSGAFCLLTSALGVSAGK